MSHAAPPVSPGQFHGTAAGGPVTAHQDFESGRFATKKELAELKKLAADASALFPTDFHDAKPKRVKKKFVEQKRAETAGTTQ